MGVWEGTRSFSSFEVSYVRGLSLREDSVKNPKSTIFNKLRGKLLNKGFFLQKQQFQLGSFLRKLRGKARKSTHLSESIMEHALRTRCKTLYNPYAHKKDLGLGPLIATP